MWPDRTLRCLHLSVLLTKGDVMQENLANRFVYPLSVERPVEHARVHIECGELADYLDEALPDGREKALAITKLEECMFWANAAIDRQGDQGG